jgi:hypothetical protein
MSFKLKKHKYVFFALIVSVFVCRDNNATLSKLVLAEKKKL